MKNEACLEVQQEVLAAALDTLEHQAVDAMSGGSPSGRRGPGVRTETGSR